MESATLKIVDDLSRISAEHWDALAGDNPVVRHAYLLALQQSGCATPQQGWHPQHLTLWQGDRLIGAMPLYLKMNSVGEHVFDFAWAEAYHRHGLRYYPKLVCAVPYTPVTGPRLLAQSAAIRKMLLDNALHLARTGKLRVEDTGAALSLAWERDGRTISVSDVPTPTPALPLQGGGSEDSNEDVVSSLHCLFLDDSDAQLTRASGMMMREDVQFHWHNGDYRDFDDFLSSLSRDKRKRIKQERRKVREAGIELRCIPGENATMADWAFFASCYAHTRRIHHSPPALNEDFFQRIGATMPQHTLLVIAYREGHAIASALNLRSQTMLYGRSWGTFEFHSGLHFETCYYQGIEYCIANGLTIFEGGAQGEHKLARGFLPAPTRSAHWLAHAQFSNAIENYLRRESEAIDEYIDELNRHSPFKRSI